MAKKKAKKTVRPIRIFGHVEFQQPFVRFLRLNDAPLPDPISLSIAADATAIVGVNPTVLAPPGPQLNGPVQSRLILVKPTGGSGHAGDVAQRKVTALPNGTTDPSSLFLIQVVEAASAPVIGEYVLRVTSGNATCEVELTLTV